MKAAQCLVTLWSNDMNSQNQALRTALVHQQKRVKELEDRQKQAEDETSRLKVCRFAVHTHQARPAPSQHLMLFSGSWRALSNR